MRRSSIATAAILAVLTGVIVRVNQHSTQTSQPAGSAAGGPTSTSRDGLGHTIETMRVRLRQRPEDREAVVLLADALLRQARVTGNAGLAQEAEKHLAAALHEEPMDYDVRRMLATVYLSEHRFRDAIREAERLKDRKPRDDWNYGVLGDAHVELGEYDEAFAAFQQMMDLRPTAAAYARAAYAFELRGHLERALEAMRLATDATSPADAESLAWHHAQLGDLYRQLGHVDAAQREYDWAEQTFPGHPFAAAGRAKLQEDRGDLRGAIAAYESLMRRAPTPDVAERLGHLYTRLGRDQDAARNFALAEAGWRFDAPQPAYLARLLADRGTRVAEAVQIAERTESERRDIFTEDALAWCYFKAGRLDEARAAIGRAERTGTKDATILAHAEAIARASGLGRGR